MAWPQTFVQTVAAIATAAGFHLAFTRLSSAFQPTEPSARGRGGTGAWRGGRLVSFTDRRTGLRASKLQAGSRFSNFGPSKT